MSVHLFICPPPGSPSEAGPGHSEAGPELGGLALRGLDLPLRGPGVGGRMDGQMYGRTDSPCSTGLCLLRFSPEPLPCSHNCYHYKIPEQGKGTDVHLLPLGDWLCINVSGRIRAFLRIFGTRATNGQTHYGQNIYRSDAKPIFHEIRSK